MTRRNTRVHSIHPLKECIAESWLWVCRSKERRLTAGRMSRVESGGIVLMLSDPLDILRAISLARAAYRKMVQHLVWATVYNVIANARSISMSELHAGEELGV